MKIRDWRESQIERCWKTHDSHYTQAHYMAGKFRYDVIVVPLFIRRAGENEWDLLDVSDGWTRRNVYV